MMPADQDSSEIRTRPRANCYGCDGAGVVRYAGLADRVYGIPGTWDLRECANRACQLVWLDPVPLEEDVWKLYRTYYTHASGEWNGPMLRLVRLLSKHGYLRVRFGYGPGSRPRWYRDLGWPGYCLISVLPGGRDIADDLACFLPAPTTGARFLEIGFGSAAKLERMLALGWTVTGIDLDPVAVQAAEARGLDARCGTLLEQAFPADSFDAIYLSHVIEHVHDPLALVRECRRVLKPGGTVVVWTPNLSSWGHRRFGSAWFPLEPPRHLVLFSPKTLRAIAERAGFSIEQLRSSARGAALLLGLSLELRECGAIESSVQRLPPLRRILVSLGYHIAESVITRFRPAAGEELLLIARKRSAGC